MKTYNGVLLYSDASVIISKIKLARGTQQKRELADRYETDQHLLLRSRILQNHKRASSFNNIKQ